MNPKSNCEKCGRILTTRKLRQHKVTGEMWCKRCLKKYGENKFYVAPRNNFISNFSISETERKVLGRKKGWERVNKDCAMLRNIRKKKRFEDYKKIRENKSKKKYEDKLNKKFVEGLK